MIMKSGAKHLGHSMKGRLKKQLFTCLCYELCAYFEEKQSSPNWKIFRFYNNSFWIKLCFSYIMRWVYGFGLQLRLGLAKVFAKQLRPWSDPRLASIPKGENISSSANKPNLHITIESPPLRVSWPSNCDRPSVIALHRFRACPE